MKNLNLIILSIFFISACNAQQPISKLSTNSVKVDKSIYNLNRESNIYVYIKNSKNKLNNVAEVAPNLPSDVKVRYNMKLDKQILTRICANVISKSTLEKMPKGMNDRLGIYIKVDAKGYPIEMNFGIINTSLITAEEIQKIEDGIMKSSFKVTFINGIERFFGGVNYFSIDVPIRYADMLKAKEGKL